MAIQSFHGLRVLALESRRVTEVASLISTYGGQSLRGSASHEAEQRNVAMSIKGTACLRVLLEYMRAIFIISESLH